jgi:four helix bundle protein
MGVACAHWRRCCQSTGVPSARKYQDLVAWQLCVELCDVVSECLGSGAISREFALRDQMRNAAHAAPAMIAEGFLRFTPDEFVRYLRMARGELGELQTHLTIATRRGLLSEAQASRLVPLANRAMAITTRLLASKLPLVKSKKRATRYLR